MQDLASLYFTALYCSACLSSGFILTSSNGSSSFFYLSPLSLIHLTASKFKGSRFYLWSRLADSAVEIFFSFHLRGQTSTNAIEIFPFWSYFITAFSLRMYSPILRLIIYYKQLARPDLKTVITLSDCFSIWNIHLN